MSIKLSKDLSSYGAISGELRQANVFLRRNWGVLARACVSAAALNP